MRSLDSKAFLSFVLAGTLSFPAWAGVGPNGAPQYGPQASAQGQSGPQAGMLNYVEGQATLGGQAVAESAVGQAHLQVGQTLATQNGRAELLLTPGVLLRLDRNTSIMLGASGLADSDLTVQSGRVMVEADQLLSANHIVFRSGNALVQPEKNGLYVIDNGQVRVFDGRAEVTLGQKTYTVQGGHQFDLTAAKPKAQGFDKKASQDDFYRWSSLRSSYLAEANADAARGFAQGYYGQSGNYSAYAAPGAGYYAGAYAPGWFWDPYFDAYTWLPYDGIFYSPFGWGFYSPAFWYAAPFYGRFGGYRTFGPGYHPAPAAVRAASQGGVFAQGRYVGNAGAAAVARPAVSGSGFRSGGGFSGGGGFHGGGGGGGGRR